MFAVVGTFDCDGGKYSSVGSKILTWLKCAGINGGHIDDLKAIDFARHSTLLWMPDIPNEEEKILPKIKAMNRELLLISSKRCVEGDYEESDIIGRLLKTRSNLGVMITKEDVYKFKLLDPLGNEFCETRSIAEFCEALKERVEFLLSLSRVPSVRIRDKEEPKSKVPKEFVEIVKRCGHEFATHINAVNPNRLLGNAATRCAAGFPAYRDGDIVYVTRRNVEKTTLSEDDFVAVNMSYLERPDRVNYWGVRKPSVDTPTQVNLFNYYKHVNFIVHGHVYVKDAPITNRKIPCGYLEEFEDIVELFPCDHFNFCVNLLGHGCLVMAQDLSYFGQVKFISRPFPEE